MKILLIILIFFTSNFLHSDEYNFSLFNAYKQDFTINEQKDNYIDRWANNIEPKYINKWITIPAIKNEMIIDGIYIPDIIGIIKDAIKDKDTYVRRINIEAFKILPYKKECTLKFVEYKVKIIEAFNAIDRVDKNNEIVFIYPIASNKIVLPNLLASDTIIVLKKIDDTLYANSYLTFSSVPKLVKALKKITEKTIHINNSKYKSLSSFCKSTGIKESEIRALNPWINKKATNIPPNAEIIVPKLNKVKKERVR